MSVLVIQSKFAVTFSSMLFNIFIDTCLYIGLLIVIIRVAIFLLILMKALIIHGMFVLLFSPQYIYCLSVSVPRSLYCLWHLQVCKSAVLRSLHKSVLSFGQKSFFCNHETSFALVTLHGYCIKKLPSLFVSAGKLSSVETGLEGNFPIRYDP